MKKIKNKKSVIFSVVVPTHGRINLLKNLISSVQRAIINGDVFVEIIIVDDSLVDQQDQIKQLCQRFKVRYVKGPLNVREKRNLGIKEARGEIILFVDSDCEVSQNIFEEHLKMYNNPDTGGVLGVTEFAGKETTTWKIVKRTKFLDAFSFAKTLCNYVDSAPWGTCTNLSFRKRILEKVGGFDTNFPFRLGGDDTDLGIRINKAGYKIKMNPNAIVFHTRDTWNNFLAVIKRIFRWGRMDYYVFYKKHKDKISPTFPKPVTVFSFLLILGFVKAITNNLLLGLSLPFIWLLLFLFLSALFKIVSSKDSLKSIFFEISAQSLHFLFDFGTIIESIKNKKLLALFKAPLDDPRQVIVLWNEKVGEVWSITFGTLFILLIFMVI
jgi:glycosyltransferase involved in cell wall biosynthesis